MKKAKKLIALLCVVLICAQMFTMMASAVSKEFKERYEEREIDVSWNTWGNTNKTLAIQKMLNYKMGAGLKADGCYGPKTKSAIKSYQKAYNLGVDGYAGVITWERLFRHCYVSYGYKNDMVKLVQHILNKVDNQTLYEDGDFGWATKCAVSNFQSKHGLSPDGAVGQFTWLELIYQYNKLNFDTAFSDK